MFFYETCHVSNVGPPAITPNAADATTVVHSRTWMDHRLPPGYFSSVPPPRTQLFSGIYWKYSTKRLTTKPETFNFEIKLFLY